MKFRYEFLGIDLDGDIDLLKQHLLKTINNYKSFRNFSYCSTSAQTSFLLFFMVHGESYDRWYHSPGPLYLTPAA